MATIKPFKAIRPRPELARFVAAPPYDVVTRDEARELTRGNEHSFLRVTKAEVDLAEGTDPHSDAVYEKARDNLKRMQEAGVMIKESADCLYIYTLIMDGRQQCGLVACASVEEYEKGIIKRHELTREDKEADRIRHMDCCDANTGPVFLAYRDNTAIREKITEWVRNNSPVYDFEAEDGVIHRVHRIDDSGYIKDLVELFGGLESLYIADGHHRNASAARAAMMRRKANPGLTEQEYDFYLAVIFPDRDLKILGYNRVVKDLNGYTVEQFMDKLAESFEISDNGEAEAPHTFGLYLRDKWYGLRAKPAILEGKEAIDLLDVSVLQDEILDKLLGIKNPRTDNRIDFVGGIRGRGELERRVDRGEMALAFELYPTSMEELMNIADQGKIMPPKSTWFEPKLRSGLFVHALS